MAPRSPRRCEKTHKPMLFCFSGEWPPPSKESRGCIILCLDRPPGTSARRMENQHTERKLAAILAADVAGYSRLMSLNEEATLRQFMAHLSELVEPRIAAHRGRIV